MMNDGDLAAVPIGVIHEEFVLQNENNQVTTKAIWLLSTQEVLGSGLKNLPTSGKLNHTAAENQNQSQPENSNKTTAFSSNQLSFQLPIAISGLLKSREMDVLPLPL